MEAISNWVTDLYRHSNRCYCSDIVVVLPPAGYI